MDHAVELVEPEEPAPAKLLLRYAQTIQHDLGLLGIKTIEQM